MIKTKLSILLLVLVVLIVRCTNKEIKPDELTDKLFTLNSNTSIIDVIYGTVDKINPNNSDFWGSKRNTKNSAINGILNELQKIDYTKEEPNISEPYYLLKFDGQLVEDKTDTFEIFIYVNPDNYKLYLDKIKLSDDKPIVEYKRLYIPNEKIKQYIDDILEIN